MEFEWDERKDAANRTKHGLSLADAARLEWLWAVDTDDVRTDYGEQRSVLYAWMGPVFCVCIYTMRQHAYRIISLRKATRHEIRTYGKLATPPFDR